MRDLAETDPLAVELIKAIRSGDIAALEGHIRRDPELARARVVRPARGSEPVQRRTLLHVAADWPGHFPNGASVVALLARFGADVGARFEGAHRETALHWAASSDDVSVLDALLDAGADIEAPGSVIDGGGPLADAVAFGQWNAARRLVERGAEASLWQAAALGMAGRVRQALESFPSRRDLANAFWCACHGGRRETAEMLLARGADINWVGHDGLTPLGAAMRAGADELAAWLRSIGAT